MLEDGNAEPQIASEKVTKKTIGVACWPKNGNLSSRKTWIAISLVHSDSIKIPE